MLAEQLAISEFTGPASRSFLKWAGGKTRSAAVIGALAPPTGFTRYIEPFCGSSAVFFALAPSRAVLSDANEDLVICLQQVRDRPEAVMVELDGMRNTRREFERVRRLDPAALRPLQRAARLIYLNKTAFRGLWRVNRHGQFNTPYGEYRRPYYNRKTMLSASKALRAAEIEHCDFAEVLCEAQPGDWVYLDPPYVPDRKWGDFKRYTSAQFGTHDQERLASALDDLDRRGVRWLLTNSDTPLIRQLFRRYPIARLPTRRDITLRSAERKSVDLVIANYEVPEHEALMTERGAA